MGVQISFFRLARIPCLSLCDSISFLPPLLPSHHRYYDQRQLQRDFGTITDYNAPKATFAGSIMNLSNTGGGGRGSDKGDIIGDVINHGKRKFWLRGGQFHYHHGLKAGEGTLEASLERLLLRSMNKNDGRFNKDDYLSAYISFMTTPNSHNDVYAGTCHRMFFANHVKGKDPNHCADNDGHNVDTIDALVPLIPIALSHLPSSSSSSNSATAALKKDIFDAINMNRKSPSLLPRYGEVYVGIVHASLLGRNLQETCEKAGAALGLNVKRMMQNTREDPMCACYIDSSFPTLLYYLHKYGENSPEEALIRSTNAGGENVARGALLGAVLGARHGLEKLPNRWVEGLVGEKEIRKEVNVFVDLAVKNAGRGGREGGGVCAQG